MAERRGTGGFTLLEVVLAMAALALMAAICYGAFHLGIPGGPAGRARRGDGRTTPGGHGRPHPTDQVHQGAVRDQP